ncbi:hypothetical protein [Streptomyces sp. NPDC056785]
MPSDVFMPGAELDEAQDMLGVVHDFIDIGTASRPLPWSTGPTR